MRKRTTHMRTFLIGVIVLAALAAVPTGAGAAFHLGKFDGEALNADGTASTQAGATPFQMNTVIAFSTKPGEVLRPGQAATPEPDGQMKSVVVDLPKGVIGNPNATPVRCTEAELVERLHAEGGAESDNCPVGSQVGYIKLTTSEEATAFFPVWNMAPPKGTAAMFGFKVLVDPVHIVAELGPENQIRARLEGISQVLSIWKSELVLWGVPADPAHDEFRGKCLGLAGPWLQVVGPELVSFFAPNGGFCPVEEAPERAFLTNPTACTAPGVGLESSLEATSWEQPGVVTGSYFTHLTPSEGGGEAGPTGCDKLQFQPKLKVAPTSSAAGSPTGLDVELSVPQNDGTTQLATSQLKDIQVAFPEGMAVNASSAAGLGGCSEQQAGVTSAPGVTPILFSHDPAACPESSKIGTVQIKTPLLEDELEGGVYLASQGTNPFHSLLALYIIVEDPQSGVVLKLPGKVAIDQRTGQLTSTFEENPQLPFETLKLQLKSGARASLVTPEACGVYTTRSELSPWSGQEPVQSVSSFTIDQGCGPQGFDPKLEAGTTNPAAGSSSPFTLRVSREDGTQGLSTISATLPKGLLASLKGIPYCSDAALGGIPTAEGTGAGQLANPSCPSASQVGTVSVGAGAGSNPFYVNTGKAYLAGPYKGAPLSLAIVTPALAGPFDLGNVVVRSALQVNAETTQVTAVSDPLPTILDGIPLDIRDVRVNIDRGEFIRNPTSCVEQQITSTIGGVGGAQAHPASRFEAANCEALPFKPKLAVQLKGKKKRTGHPALTATLTFPEGATANTAKAQVGLPGSEFLDQGNIKTVCTRPQLAAHACPAASVYGHATAVSPLLDQPLTGPVYLGTGYGTKLPMLVAELNGQISVILRGKIDTDKQKGIRATFAEVPDAPISKFTLSMQGGPKKGLIENSTDICRNPQKANVSYLAQNGAKVEAKAPLSASCGGGKNKKSKGKKK
jgi:hypothetical protein